MTKFLIQFENGIPAYDFCYETIKSIEYNNWIIGEEEYSYRPTQLIELELLPNKCYEARSCVPIGSVEFIHKYMKLCNIPIPPPTNIPQELTNYCFQYLRETDFNHLVDYKKEIFIKSQDIIKHPKNGRVNQIPEGKWQVTTPIDISSEWRCFVFKGKLIDLKCYSGDSFILPRSFWIDHCIDMYKSAPIAYTLDVAISFKNTKKKKRVDTVIECHDMYSCGFYGFSGKYPVLMQSAWWKEYLDKWKKN